MRSDPPNQWPLETGQCPSWAMDRERHAGRSDVLEKVFLPLRDGFSLMGSGGGGGRIWGFQGEDRVGLVKSSFPLGGSHWGDKCPCFYGSRKRGLYYLELEAWNLPINKHDLSISEILFNFSVVLCYCQQNVLNMFHWIYSHHGFVAIGHISNF